MHLKVALSIALIMSMELLLIRSVQNLHLAALRSDRISIEQMLQDAGFERISFLLSLYARSCINVNSLMPRSVFQGPDVLKTMQEIRFYPIF
jgi:hypothetical protein